MTRSQQLCATALFVAACAEAHYTASPNGPAVTLPHHIAEGNNPDAIPVASGSAAPSEAPSAAAAPRSPEPPEPAPLRIADQWEYELLYDRGNVSVVRVTAKRFPHPVVTKRNLGRFAIELWIGHELVDRVGFDFPAIGGEVEMPKTPAPRPPPSLTTGARSRVRLLVPASPRARRALLIDRQTKSETPLPWPPDHPLPPPESSAPAMGAAP